MELQAFKDSNIEELSMVEVAYAILEESGDVHDFNQLLETIQAYLNLSEEQLEGKMARFYTDLNIDGRFISLGENRWGLRAWYAIDAIDEEIVNSIDDEDLPRHRRRKKKRTMNAFDEHDDMIDYNDDDPEDVDDIYDQIDEDDVFSDNEDDEDDDDEEVNDKLASIESEDIDEDDDADAELEAYASDLSELGGEEADLDDDFVGDDEEDDDLEDDFDQDENTYSGEEPEADR